MKKVLAIITVAVAASVFALAGCQKKEEAPKPAAVSTPTSTATAPMSATTPTAPAAPAHE